MTDAGGFDPPASSAWLDETLYPDLGQRFRIEREVYRERTPHQDLMIAETARFGRVLMLDGVVQLTEADEFIYHEMMAHVPILAHGGVREIAIVGGGDGGVLRRCLDHDTVERVTLIELDREVIDLIRTHIPSICGQAFADPRTDLVIADGARHLAETRERFDVVIVDSTDPFGPGAVLFTPEFYRVCRSCLRPGGILITQSGVPFLQPAELTLIARNLAPVFDDVAFYLVAVPSYYGGHMALGFASESDQARLVDQPTLEARFAAARLETRYYTPAIHRAAFALPPWMSGLIA